MPGLHRLGIFFLPQDIIMIEKISKTITLMVAIVVTTWLTWTVAGIFLDGWLLVIAAAVAPIILVFIVGFIFTHADNDHF